MINIVADSSCEITEVKEGNYFRAPLKILVGDTEFVDTPDLDVKDMMDKMYAYSGKTSSACPSPDYYANLFRKPGDVIALTITSGLSGSYQSACLARDMVLEEEPDKKIYVVNTLSCGGELALMVRKINELIEEGLGFDEVVAEIEEYRKHTHLLFMLNSMDNLIKNGRVSKMVGMAANLLKIKIIGRANEEGVIELIHKVRGEKKLILTAFEEMKRRGYTGGKTIISHCFNLEGALELKKTILNEFKDACIEIFPMSGLCSFYAEKGGYIVGFEGK